MASNDRTPDTTSANSNADSGGSLVPFEQSAAQSLVSSDSEPEKTAEPRSQPARTTPRRRRKAELQTANPLGVLTGKEIEELKIIEVEDPNYISTTCYAPASYDLRLGNEFYIPDPSEPRPRIQLCADNGGFLTIPPFSSALISTYENLCLPLNVVGRFDLRVSWALSGLVFQMGTQIEPGYHGKLFGLLHNMTDRPKQIRFKNEQDRPLTAEFHYTSSPAIVPPQARPLVQMVDFLREDMVSGSIATLAASTAAQSQALLKRIEIQANEITSLAKELQSVTHNKWALYLLVATIVLSIALPVVITKVTYDRDAFPLSTQIDLQSLTKTITDNSARATSDYFLKRPEFILLEQLSQLKAERKALAAERPNDPDLKRLDAEIQELIAQLSR